MAADRDAYDFLVARTFAYDDLRYAWDSLDPLAKPRVIEHCQYRAEGIMPPPDRSRELSDVRYLNLVEGLWEHLKRLFETALDYGPPLNSE